VNPSGPGGALPGWYPDPWGAKAWRWWDGYAWTGHAADPSVPIPHAGHGFQPAAAPTGYQPLYYAATSVHEWDEKEHKAAPWAKRAFFGYIVTVGLRLLAAWAAGQWLRRLFDDIRTQAGSGSTPTIATGGSTGFTLITWLNVLAEIAVFLVLLNWQYRAAKTAQSLGLPASHSPGLGVGGWFIPVVNLWFPYQAIRDCLPPEDPGRQVVGRMWACYIAMQVAMAVGTVLAWLGNPLGFVFGGLALALAAGFAFNGARAVQRIADAHQRLLYPGQPIDRGRDTVR
jgi:hypothetical protein